MNNFVNLTQMIHPWNNFDRLYKCPSCLVFSEEKLPNLISFLSMNQVWYNEARSTP